MSNRKRTTRRKGQRRRRANRGSGALALLIALAGVAALVVAFVVLPKFGTQASERRQAKAETAQTAAGQAQNLSLQTSAADDGQNASGGQEAGNGQSVGDSTQNAGDGQNGAGGQNAGDGQNAGNSGQKASDGQSGGDSANAESSQNAADGQSADDGQNAGDSKSGAGSTALTQADAADRQANAAKVQAALNAQLQYPDRVIRDGIRIDGVDVSGLTETQAKEQVQADIEQKKQAVVTLRGKEQGQSVQVTAGDLGLVWANPEVIDEVGSYGQASNIIARYKQDKDLQNHGQDFAVEYIFDKQKMENVLGERCAAFNQEAQDAALKRENGKFRIVGGQTGYVVDTAASAEKIYSALTDGWNGESAEVALEIRTDEPRGSEEELAQVKDVLGTFTTSYSSSGTARSENIANGTKLINDHVLYPGDEFSVLNALIPFTEENGYYLAGSYLGGQVVDSLGGGICQVSTTLYNALIRAELEITERYNHSMVVGYVDLSMDAAIAESSGMDLRFKNNTDYPVYIEGYTQGKSVTFNIYGVETRDASRKISFESEMISRTEPEGQKIYTDASQPVGYIRTQSAHIGYKARLWKIVEENGKEISREVFNNSTYMAEPMSATVGTAGAVSVALSQAIASNSIDAVKAALSGAPADNGANDALASAAQAAAQQAFANALAQGADQATATAAAQAAANQVVAAQSGQQPPSQPQEQAPAAPAETTEPAAPAPDAAVPADGAAQ